MKKVLKSLLMVFMIFFTSISLTSCLGFFEDDEALVISRITTNTLENGNIEVKIIYENEDVAPTSFIIPKGQTGDEGKEGNGIKEIITQKNPTNTGTILKIVYTDILVEPTIVEVKDGLSVQGVSSSVDPTTQDTLLVVHYTDGSKSDPIPIPRGIDGNGITGIDQRINRDFSVTLTFKMTNEEDVTVQIPAPQKGEDGRGIESIVAAPNNDEYMMIITYTDGTSQNLEFARPNKWFSESALPTNEDGIDGDLWYDLAHNSIYVKQNGSWKEVLNLSQIKEDTYTVIFNLNDDLTNPASMPTGSLLSYDIPIGNYFHSSGYDIPLPTRNGYTFIGWYTTKSPNVIHGAFNDLTPVYSDLTLYAIWEEN